MEGNSFTEEEAAHAATAAQAPPPKEYPFTEEEVAAAVAAQAPLPEMEGNAFTEEEVVDVDDAAAAQAPLPEANAHVYIEHDAATAPAQVEVPFDKISESVTDQLEITVEDYAFPEHDVAISAAQTSPPEQATMLLADFTQWEEEENVAAVPHLIQEERFNDNENLVQQQHAAPEPGEVSQPRRTRKPKRKNPLTVAEMVQHCRLKRKDAAAILNVSESLLSQRWNAHFPHVRWPVKDNTIYLSFIQTVADPFLSPEQRAAKKQAQQEEEQKAQQEEEQKAQQEAQQQASRQQAQPRQALQQALLQHVQQQAPQQTMQQPLHQAFPLPNPRLQEDSSLRPRMQPPAPTRPLSMTFQAQQQGPGPVSLNTRETSSSSSMGWMQLQSPPSESQEVSSRSPGATMQQELPQTNPNLQGESSSIPPMREDNSSISVRVSYFERRRLFQVPRTAGFEYVRMFVQQNFNLNTANFALVYREDSRIIFDDPGWRLCVVDHDTGENTVLELFVTMQ